MEQEIEVSNEELNTLNRALFMLGQYEIDIIAGFVVRQLVQALKPHLAVLQETEEAALKKYSERDKDDKPVVLGMAQDQRSLVYRLDKAKTGAHALEKHELMKEKVTVKVPRLLRASLLMPKKGKGEQPDTMMLSQILVDLGPLLDMDIDLEKLLGENKGQEEKDGSRE
jgi:hypothetical protein